MVTEEQQMLRERSLELIDQVETLLSQPRDPEVVRRAAEWQRDHERRQAEERATEAAQAERDAALRPVPKAAPAPAAQPVAYVTRKRFDAHAASMHKIVGHLTDKVFDTFASARTKTTWRFEEAERRIADLEERIAKMEERGNG